MHKRKRSALAMMEAYYLWGKRSWEDDVTLHVKAKGVVILKEDLVLFARPVNSYASFADIVNPAIAFDLLSSDMWHVHFMAGSITQLVCISETISRYPIISFQRGRRDDEYLHHVKVNRRIRFICG